MFCKHVTDIFSNYIHSNLTRDEYIYSQEVKETLLDMVKNINSVGILEGDEFNNSKFYFIENDESPQFEIMQDQNYGKTDIWVNKKIQYMDIIDDDYLLYSLDDMISKKFNIQVNKYRKFNDGWWGKDKFVKLDDNNL